MHDGWQDIQQPESPIMRLIRGCEQHCALDPPRVPQAGILDNEVLAAPGHAGVAGEFLNRHDLLHGVPRVAVVDRADAGIGDEEVGP